jgi:ABC-type lipoprotein export system ATPase subunit
LPLGYAFIRDARVRRASRFKMNAVLSCEELCCERTDWNDGQHASIHGITLSFSAASFCWFEGPDSSGRDLLLSNLSLLEPADSGKILLEGQNVRELPEDELRRFRNERFGFLFEHPCLLPSFSVTENVAMPLFRICGADAQAARARTDEVLHFCGIPHLENQLAGRLAPSEQRRAALARALVHRPRILVANAPRESEELFELAARVASELRLCVLWAAADAGGRRRPQRVIKVEDGRISSDQHL